MKLMLAAIALLGYFTFTWQTVSTQEHVRIAIDTSVAPNVNITWTQISDATEVCISKRVSGGWWVLIDCIPSQPGPNSFSTLYYVDGSYKHQYGDVYYIDEYKDQVHYGRSQPYEAFHYYYLMRFDKPVQ